MTVLEWLKASTRYSFEEQNFIKIALDRGLACDTEKLLFGAEQWARRRGGRSPRCARQFIDYVEGCEKRGIEW